MKLGEWIKQYRAERKLSMQDFADMCGFSKAYIGQLEKGINPSTGNLFPLRFRPSIKSLSLLEWI